MTTPELLDTSDYTLAQNRNLGFFLELAGEVIRDYCHWHIAPQAVTTAIVPVTSDGLIVLPTQRAVSVGVLKVGGVTIASTGYVLHESGYIELTAARPWLQTTIEAEVTFTHGYDETPFPVRDVGNRLAQRAMTSESGAVSSLQAGPFTVSYGAALMLNPSDTAQLAPYVLLKLDM